MQMCKRNAQQHATFSIMFLFPQLYSGSRDGTLRLWDLSTHACVRVLLVREPVRSLAIYAPLNLAYISIEWRDGVSGRVICYSLDKGRPGATAMKTRAAGPLAMASPNGAGAGICCALQSRTTSSHCPRACSAASVTVSDVHSCHNFRTIMYSFVVTPAHANHFPQPKHNNFPFFAF